MTKNQKQGGTSLEQSAPELCEYLKPGMKILDVGCGTGDITRAVAEAAYPGEVVGVDSWSPYIEEAQGYSDELDSTRHILFQFGDCHKLDFEENAFDLVYSKSALHFFIDPLKALGEQKRVAKEGGTVIAAGVRINDPFLRYPNCPNWAAVRYAQRQMYSRIADEYTKSGMEPEAFLSERRKESDTFAVYSHAGEAGKKAPGWFAATGFTDIAVKIIPERIQFFGNDLMESGAWDDVVIEGSENAFVSQFEKRQEMMVSAGLISRNTLEEAKKEIREWYKRTDAFAFNLLVFVSGKA